MNTAHIRVLIVDDHPLLRVGAATYLSSSEHLEVVGEADNAVDAFELAKSKLPDVVLLDIRLKGTENGIALARWIKTEVPSIKLLVLTNFFHDPYIKAMMECGVEGYLLKDTAPSDVANAIRIIAGGGTVFSSGIAKAMVQGYLGSSPNADVQIPERLTAKEMEVLQLITVHASTRDLADHMHISVKGVQQHLTAIYAKLEVRGRTEAIIKASRTGLIVLDDENMQPAGP